MTERDAFIIGVTRYCKKAGLDIDDTEQMTRLLFMPPFRAQPIIKRASTKRAGLWDWLETAGNFWFGDPAQERLRAQTQNLQAATQEAMAPAVSLARQIRQETDPAKQQQLREQHAKVYEQMDTSEMDRGRQAVVGQQAVLDATPEQRRHGLVRTPTVNTAQQAAAAKGVPTEEEDIAAAMPETMKRLGMTPEEWKAQQTRTQEAQAMRQYVQQLQRQHRVSDPRYLPEGTVDWKTPFGQRMQEYLQQRRGTVGQGRRPYVVGSGGSRAPTGVSSNPQLGMTPPEPTTAPQAAASQMSSSPPPDAVPSRGSMSHLMSEPPPPPSQAAPQQAAAAAAAPAGTSAGGAPPEPGISGQGAWGKTGYGTTATDMDFATDPRVQEMTRATQAYRRGGGTGSVEIPLASGGTFRA